MKKENFERAAILNRAIESAEALLKAVENSNGYGELMQNKNLIGMAEVLLPKFETFKTGIAKKVHDLLKDKRKEFEGL